MARQIYFVFLKAKSFDEAVECAEDALLEYRGLIHNHAELIDKPGDFLDWLPPSHIKEIGIDAFFNLYKEWQRQIADDINESIGELLETTLQDVLEKHTENLCAIIIAMKMQNSEFTYKSPILNVVEDSTRISDKLGASIRRNPRSYWLLPYDLRT